MYFKNLRAIKIFGWVFRKTKNSKIIYVYIIYIYAHIYIF